MNSFVSYPGARPPAYLSRGGALGIVLISFVIFLILSVVACARPCSFHPPSSACDPAGIGLFVAFMDCERRLIVAHPGTLT